MRIEKSEALAAVSVVRKYLGASAAVWLFGSRVDDAQKGGDVDLYVETDEINLAIHVARARGELADVLGRYVDLVVNNHTKDEAIYEVARSQGVRLA
jgi:predicted nucleotidyltransferase